jgi:hypothetical protein
MININKEKVPTINKVRGEQITAGEINAASLAGFIKINSLNPTNIGPVNSGKYMDATRGSLYYNFYVNAVSWSEKLTGFTASSLDAESTTTIDPLIDELTADIQEIIDKYGD